MPVSIFTVFLHNHVVSGGAFGLEHVASAYFGALFSLASPNPTQRHPPHGKYIATTPPASTPPASTLPAMKDANAKITKTLLPPTNANSYLSSNSFLEASYGSSFQPSQGDSFIDRGRGNVPFKAILALVVTRAIAKDGPPAHEIHTAPRRAAIVPRRASTGCISTGVQSYPPASQRRLPMLRPSKDALKTVSRPRLLLDKGVDMTRPSTSRPVAVPRRRSSTSDLSVRRPAPKWEPLAANTPWEACFSSGWLLPDESAPSASVRPLAPQLEQRARARQLPFRV